MNCPSCKVPLVMSDRQGIEIDYCPQCRGIWLDRGELDKIIERSGIETQKNPQFNRQAPESHPQHGYYKEHKKKHWLNELFD
jgi:Zn-finger nucleic acid-binding protein